MATKYDQFLSAYHCSIQCNSCFTDSKTFDICVGKEKFLLQKPFFIRYSKKIKTVEKQKIRSKI